MNISPITVVVVVFETIIRTLKSYKSFNVNRGNWKDLPDDGDVWLVVCYLNENVNTQSKIIITKSTTFPFLPGEQNQ